MQSVPGLADLSKTYEPVTDTIKFFLNHHSEMPAVFYKLCLNGVDVFTDPRN